MKLLHKNWNFCFEFKENTKNLLVIEHPGVFTNLVRELLEEMPEEESGFILSEEGVLLKRKDCLSCVVNPVSVTLNERRLLGKLNESVKTQIFSSELLIEGNQCLSELENYAAHILQSSDWNLSYSEKLDVSAILKILDIHFWENQSSLLEKIVDYIQVTHDLLGIKCFVFIHLFAYLTKYELEKLYEYVHYQKIPLLLIESKQPEGLKDYSKVVIIDGDACEIALSVP